MEKSIEKTNQCATKNNNNLGIKFTKKKFEKKIVMKKLQKSKTSSKTKKAIKLFGKKSCPSGKRKSHQTCCYNGCSNNAEDKNLSWHIIPPELKHPKSDRYEQIKNYHIKNRQDL